MMQNNVYVPTQGTQAEMKFAVDSYRYKKREVGVKRKEAEEGIKKRRT
jgi:hypothetical protein